MTATSSAKSEQRRRPPRANNCRQFARKELAAAYPAILHRFIEEATKGSIPHAKALIAMAGMEKDEPTPVKARARRGGAETVGGGEVRTLSELLLLELRRGSETMSDATKLSK